MDQRFSLTTWKKQFTTWTKSIIVEARILEISKLFLLGFRKIIMKKETKGQICIKAQKSFIYEILTPNFYKGLIENATLRNNFDPSNLQEKLEFHDHSNCKPYSCSKANLQVRQLKSFAPDNKNCFQKLQEWTAKCLPRGPRSKQRPN